MFTFSLDTLVYGLDVRKLVGLAVEPNAADLALVGLGIGVHVLVIPQVFQAVKPAWRIANSALVRLEKKV